MKPKEFLISVVGILVLLFPFAFNYWKSHYYLSTISYQNVEYQRISEKSMTEAEVIQTYGKAPSSLKQKSKGYDLYKEDSLKDGSLLLEVGDKQFEIYKPDKKAD